MSGLVVWHSCLHLGLSLGLFRDLRDVLGIIQELVCLIRKSSEDTFISANLVSLKLLVIFEILSKFQREIEIWLVRIIIRTFRRGKAITLLTSVSYPTCANICLVIKFFLPRRNAFLYSSPGAIFRVFFSLKLYCFIKFHLYYGPIQLYFSFTIL
jgi:hypothetical protein